MRIYVDCTNGVSTDMMEKALLDLADGSSAGLIQQQLAALGTLPHHRGYRDIEQALQKANLDEAVKKSALAIYLAIARAEAAVHGEDLDTVHFHEVGRDEAIRNIVSICSSLAALDVTEIYCSAIHDGHGTIQCSHGEIPVPVPAVQELKKQCDYTFRQDDVPTEMVTPGGLATLIGIGAICRPDLLATEGVIVSGQQHGQAAPILATGRGQGTRDIGRDGLFIHSF